MSSSDPAGTQHRDASTVAYRQPWGRELECSPRLGVRQRTGGEGPCRCCAMLSSSPCCSRSPEGKPFPKTVPKKGGVCSEGTAAPPLAAHPLQGLRAHCSPSSGVCWALVRWGEEVGGAPWQPPSRGAPEPGLRQHRPAQAAGSQLLSRLRCTHHAVTPGCWRLTCSSSSAAGSSWLPATGRGRDLLKQRRCSEWQVPRGSHPPPLPTPHK